MWLMETGKILGLTALNWLELSELPRDGVYPLYFSLELNYNAPALFTSYSNNIERHHKRSTYKTKAEHPLFLELVHLYVIPDSHWKQKKKNTLSKINKNKSSW